MERRGLVAISGPREDYYTARLPSQAVVRSTAPRENCRMRHLWCQIGPRETYAPHTLRRDATNAYDFKIPDRVVTRLSFSWLQSKP